MKDKIIFVTGSSRGIGRAIALKAAEEGADVIVHYSSSAAQAEEVAGRIESMGRRAHTVRGNWSVPAEVLKACEEAWKAFGKIDILINNAGLNLKKHFLETRVEDFDAVFGVNVKGTFLATHTIAHLMVAARIEGQILTVTSINGIRPGAGFSVYGATKGALEMMMKGAALDLSPHGIRVNTIAAGAVRTDMNADVVADPELFKTAVNSIPMKRIADPEEIADITCAIASSSGSYMTGSTILADGGMNLIRGHSFARPYPPDRGAR